MWLQAGWSVSEKFSYQQNFPAKNSEARRRWLPPIQSPPPGKARPSATVFRLIKPPTAGRKILWVGRFPKPQAAGPRIRQSFRLKAGLRTRKSGLLSLPKNFPTNKIFLPHIPRFGADFFHWFNALRPAQFTCFSLFKKPPVDGGKILWVGHNHWPTPYPAKNGR